MNLEDKIRLLASIVKDLTCIVGDNGDRFLATKLKQMHDQAQEIENGR